MGRIRTALASVPRLARWLPVAILLVSFGLRLAHVLSMRSDVFFEHPQNDEGLYVALGRRLARGLSAGEEPWFQPPGLATVLSLQFRLGLESLLWTRLLHVALGTATCGLVYVIARRFASVRVALLAAFLAAIHGPSIHAAGEILSPVWIAFLDAIALMLITRERPRWTDAMGGGLALGLSALFSPVILPFLLPAAVWLALKGQQKRYLLVAVLAVGALGPPLAVTSRNHQRSGEWVFVAANGGINFFLGNNAAYRETLSIRPGRDWTELDEEPVRRGIRRLGERSEYFYRRGWAFVADRPMEAGALYVRKLLLFFSAHQIPRNSDLIVARMESPVLHWLVGTRSTPLPDGLLVPLGLVGAVVLLRKREWVLPWFLGTQAVVIAAFFVTSRYRIPSMPVVCILAAVGAWWVLGQFRRTRMRGILCLASVSVLCMASAWPWWETRISLASERQFFRGIAYWHELGAPASAVPFFERATALDPNDPRPWFELGNAYEALGRTGEAEEAWMKAANADPDDPRPRRKLAGLRATRADFEAEGRTCAANVNRAAPTERIRDRLCVVQAQLRRGDHLDAIAILKQLILLDARSVTEARGAILGSFPQGTPDAVVATFQSTIDAADVRKAR